MSLALPSGKRRALVQSFCLTLGIVGGVLWLALAWGLRVPGLVVAALATVAVSGAVAVTSERFAWRVYHAWNRRIVQPFESMATRLVMTICFRIISFTAAGGASAQRFATRDPQSAWTARTSLAPDAYRAAFVTLAAAGDDGWIHGYLRWARGTGNVWSVSLVPFLCMLKLLAPEQQSSAHENIYTLF